MSGALHILGEFIYVLALGLFGRSVSSTGFHYDGSAHGNALFDAAKMIRILMYFFSNMIITVFFKDIETMYLNEHHNIDEEFLGLGVTLRQIHGSLTNGLISFIYSIALNDNMVGGGIESPLEIDYENESIEQIVQKIEYAIEQHPSFLKVIPQEELMENERLNKQRNW